MIFINAANGKEIKEKINYYAFLQGIQTVEMRECLLQDFYGESVLFCIDQEGLEQAKKHFIKLPTAQYQVVIVAKTTDEKWELQEKYSDLYENILHPFTFQRFKRQVAICMEERGIEEQILDYGKLQIDRGSREIRVCGQLMNMSCFDYEILMVLMEHMGEVLSREQINGCLPERKRTTQRNIDTHIKNIRKIPGMRESIRSVRSMGYGINPEKFFEVMKRN